MPTVNSMIQRLLPRGSNPGRPGVWAELPLWPPDVFAVCATLVDRSGCYASPRYANGYPDGADGCFFSGADYYDDINYYDDIDDLARVGEPTDWTASSSIGPFSWIPRHGEVADHDHPTAQTWQDTAIVLMMVADKVCVAMGFAPRPDLEEEKKRRRISPTTTSSSTSGCSTAGVGARVPPAQPLPDGAARRGLRAAEDHHRAGRLHASVTVAQPLPPAELGRGQNDLEVRRPVGHQSRIC